jgi:hypothetical protein
MRVTLWLTDINMFWVSEGKPEGELNPEKEKVYSEANIFFLWCTGWSICRNSVRYISLL